MAGQEHILAYLTRHGTTEANTDGDRFRGLDIPLDRQGVRDALKLASYFENIDLYPAIFHSSKHRTRDSAKIIAERKSTRTIEHTGLNNWDKGTLAGRKKTPDNLALLKHHVEHPDIPIPGGESLNEFRNRLRPLIVEGIDLACECGLPILFIVHSSVIHDVGEFINGDMFSTLVKPGGVAAIYVKNGKLKAEPVFKPDQAPQGSYDSAVHS